MKSASYAFVIPAYNPDKHLVKVVQNILQKSACPIFIIDDGSSEESRNIFLQLQQLNEPRIVLMAHAVNLGKGAALKTVFNHILVNHPSILGVVTLDSDGQHTLKDCLHTLDNLEKNPKSFVLGYRTFSRDIPLKSYLGNTISKWIYKFVLGYGFKDTQTGLRGLSREFMKRCLKIPSNRFEFETEQLAIAANERQPIIEIPIKTIYIEQNRATTFRPLLDSFRIYFVLFRYGLASIITAFVDFLVFLLAISFGANIFWANMAARTASIGVQYTLLDKYVFQSKAHLTSFVLFAFYVYFMGAVSAIIQEELVQNLHFPIVAAKILVEGILFFVNFAFLRFYIFTTKSKREG